MDCNNRMTNGRMMNNRMPYRPEQSGMMPGCDAMSNDRMPCNRMSGNRINNNRVSGSRMCSNGCDVGTAPVDEMGPGMSYVPWQQWNEVYDLERAFNCGTIFPELNKPFVGRGGK